VKILWLTTKFPYPPDSGGKSVTYHTIKYLSLKHCTITLCTLSGGQGPIPEQFKKLVDIHIPPSALKDKRNHVNLVANVFARKPYIIEEYHSEAAWEFISGLLESKSYDIIHCDHLHTAQYGVWAKENFRLPAVLTAHNVESILWQAASRVGHNLAKRAYCYLQGSKMRSYEAQIIGDYDGLVTLSLYDATQMKKLNPNVEPTVVPPGVDSQYFKPASIYKESGAIAFVGALDWLPNADGILWFTKHVWPKVKKRYASAKLYVIGAGPSRVIRLLANDPDIIVTGYVHDVRSYLSKAQIFIAPLRIGSGVRIKVLHALAMGTAVVSTPLACQGIAVTNGENILIAETVDDFADSLVLLLTDEKQRKRLGQSGRQLVQRDYRWEDGTDRIYKLYQSILRS
jgi:polysaccharide biosynthesis protein PslH